MCDLTAVELIHVCGDTHIYSNHKDAISEHFDRDPFPFPTVQIDPNVKDIDQIRFEHIRLLNYVSHPAIQGMTMAV